MTSPQPDPPEAPPSPKAILAVIVAALGYFVDIYDLVLFGVIREKSLIGLGITAKEELTRQGTQLINLQMIGMLVGGILWGVIGDKRGRLSVLFGSIITYSLANIGNGLVHDTTSYGILRFVAGVGLAGELGAGVTLVSESLSKKQRGYGTTAVAAIGILGAVVAVAVGKYFTDWRVAYFVGGGLGFLLLLLRIGVVESSMFRTTSKDTTVKKGQFLALFAKPKRALRYLCLILVGIPVWYAVGVLFFFAPEIGEAMGLNPRPTAGNAILYGYIGLSIGDVASGAASQLMKSRIRALGLFLFLTSMAIGAYFIFGPRSGVVFNWMCLAIGVGAGYWAVFVTMSSEQFGTNLRATATTTTPNFVRGAVVPLTSAFTYLKAGGDARYAAMIVGGIALAGALAGLFALDETFGRNLDFTED